MKQLIFFLALNFLFAGISAQSPQGFNYQAVVRNNNGEPLINNQTGVKISILTDTIQNSIEYSELHFTTTDNFGRMNLQVGFGEIISGNFPEIPWESENIFLRTEIDPEGGTNFQMLGEVQLLSVPYALFADRSGQTYSAGQGISIEDNVISNTGDLSNTNELQVISISGDTIFLSNGGFAKLPPATNAIVPLGGCLQSTNPEPPPGYAYSGTGFTAGDQWYEMPQMSHARFGAAVVTIQNQIYVFGGWDGINPVSNIVEVFNTETETWTRKANMNTAVAYPAFAVAGNNIHILGGYTGSNYTNRHQVYNTQGNSWSLAQVLPQARSGGGAANIDDKIYLIGGYDGAVLSLNQMYNPATNSWTTKTAMPSARTDFAIAQLFDGIYAIGGWSDDVLNVNEFYHPQTDTWYTYYPSITYRAGAGAAVVDNKIYLIGGGNQYNYTGTTEVYDPLTNEWQFKASFSSPRSYFGAVNVNDKIYVVGGNFGYALKTMFSYNPETVQFYIHCSE
jgi:N-acetylneuraminic acid mutarotase